MPGVRAVDPGRIAAGPPGTRSIRQTVPGVRTSGSVRGMNRIVRPLASWATLVLLAGACHANSPTAPGFPDGNVRVLFIGNSLTYTNDLPGMFVALARQVGSDRVQAAGIAFPDFALEDHWNEGSARRALREHDWEFVVMQQGSSALPANQVNLRTWAAQFTPEIRAAGAVPVLFMVWPTTSRLGDFPAVLQSYRDAASAVDGIFAPAGDGWTAFGSLQGLYRPDGLHPSVAGTYIAALVLLERTVGIRPDQLPARIPGVPMSEDEVRALQLAARMALDRNPARPTGAAPAGLAAAGPGFLRRLTASRCPCQLPTSTY